jgi:hypothetical protein
MPQHADAEVKVSTHAAQLWGGQEGPVTNHSLSIWKKPNASIKLTDTPNLEILAREYIWSKGIGYYIH